MLSPAGQWEDHRGLLDFNMLSGDWPDALPATAGDFPRQGRSSGVAACRALASFAGMRDALLRAGL